MLVFNGRILLEEALMQQIKNDVRLRAGSCKAVTNSHVIGSYVVSGTFLSLFTDPVLLEYQVSPTENWCLYF